MNIKQIGITAAAWAAVMLNVTSLCEQLSAGGLSAQSPRQTVMDGIYTSEQAKRGQTAYAENCTTCHLEDLSGTDRGPALVGDSFIGSWLNSTIGDLFDRTQRSMPADRPGSLRPSTVRDVVAFLLQSNDYPAGPRELVEEFEALRTIEIVRKN